MRGLETDLYSLENQILLFEESPKEKKARERKISQLRNEIDKLRPQLEEIESGKIYHNAFEWRFEFPEVLDDKGDFVGFDVVIGNPPYISIEDITWDQRRFYETIYQTATGRFDLYSLFIEKAMQIKQPTGVFTYIIPGKFLNNKQWLFGLCYAMEGGYKGWNPYRERHLAIFVNCFCSRAN